MKRTFLFILALLFISFAGGTILYKLLWKGEGIAASQSSYFLQAPPDDITYYWFDVRVRTNTRDKHYKLISTSNGVMSGSIKKFQKYLWRNLANRRIAVGPFMSPQDAQKALLIYKAIARTKSKDDLRNINIPDFGHEVYWFALKFTESQRLRYYVFEHNPARVESGTARDFVNSMYEALNYQMINIGPFEDYQRTEEIKRMYRQNE